MPRVPTYDNFEVAPTTNPSQKFESNVSPDAMAIPGRQLQQLGQGMQSAGASMARVVYDAQNEANQLREDDALNQLKERAMELQFDKSSGFTSQRGIQALERQSGKPLADEYTEALKDQASSIAGSLGNDAQRMGFAKRANDVLTQFRGQAIAHESQQFREYALSVRDGTIKNRMNSIGLNYNNPTIIDEDVQSIQAATFEIARLQGRSAEWAEAEARKMTSNAHMVAIGAAINNNDIAYADGYLKKYSKQLDADDLLKVRGLITKEMDNRVGMATATQVVQGMAGRVVTSDGNRAWNILIGAESRGRQFGDDDSPLTSPKGAIGRAQVMPTTGPEAAKLAGLPWNEELFNRRRTGDEVKDREAAEYNEALGRAYFTKQLQDFNGNLAQAYAAYNAGPGATRDAIKKAGAAGTDNWTQYLPEETQKYVAQNMNAYGAGQGAYQRPTLQDVHNEVRAKVGDNPGRLKVAIEESTRQFEDMQKAVKQREDEGVANAMRAVQANGGRFSELPVSIRAAIPAKEVDNVMTFAQKIAKGDDVTDKALYNKLASDRQYLQSLSDNEFYMLRTRLSESDFKEFAKERGQLKQGKPGTSPDDLNTEAINSTLNDRLRILKIDPTPKDGSTDAERVGAIRQFVRTQILSSQQNSGKKFTDAEVVKSIDEMFARNTTFRTLIGSESGPMLRMKVGDIPSDVKTSIKADFKKLGVSDPTDGQILQKYWEISAAMPKPGEAPELPPGHSRQTVIPTEEFDRITSELRAAGNPHPSNADILKRYREKQPRTGGATGNW